MGRYDPTPLDRGRGGRKRGRYQYDAFALQQDLVALDSRLVQGTARCPLCCRFQTWRTRVVFGRNPYARLLSGFLYGMRQVWIRLLVGLNRHNYWLGAGLAWLNPLNGADERRGEDHHAGGDTGARNAKKTNGGSKLWGSACEALHLAAAGHEEARMEILAESGEEWRNRVANKTGLFLAERIFMRAGGVGRTVDHVAGRSPPSVNVDHARRTSRSHDDFHHQDSVYMRTLFCYVQFRRHVTSVLPIIFHRWLAIILSWRATHGYMGFVKNLQRLTTAEVHDVMHMRPVVDVLASHKEDEWSLLGEREAAGRESSPRPFVIHLERSEHDILELRRELCRVHGYGCGAADQSDVTAEGGGPVLAALTHKVLPPDEQLMDRVLKRMETVREKAGASSDVIGGVSTVETETAGTTMTDHSSTNVLRDESDHTTRTTDFKKQQHLLQTQITEFLHGCRFDWRTLRFNPMDGHGKRVGSGSSGEGGTMSSAAFHASQEARIADECARRFDYKCACRQLRWRDFWGPAQMALVKEHFGSDFELLGYREGDIRNLAPL